MSDKIQHTSIQLKEKMLLKYGDELHHKHNKDHLEYRRHCKTHPCKMSREYKPEPDYIGSTGLVRQLKLVKLRKRFDKGRFH